MIKIYLDFALQDSTLFFHLQNVSVLPHFNQLFLVYFVLLFLLVSSGKYSISVHVWLEIKKLNLKEREES